MNLQRSLETLHNGPRTKAALSDIHEAEKEFDKVLGWEEEYWRQRSRVEWLKYSDKNTKYFHSKASSRRNESEIIGRDNKERHWRENDEEIKGVV